MLLTTVAVLRTVRKSPEQERWLNLAMEHFGDGYEFHTRDVTMLLMVGRWLEAERAKAKGGRNMADDERQRLMAVFAAAKSLLAFLDGRWPGMITQTDKFGTYFMVLDEMCIQVEQPPVPPRVAGEDG